MKGVRADVRLVELGLAPSREKARSLIMAGVVFADGKRVDKAGEPLGPEQDLTVKEDPVPFVSRGGLKLAKAIQAFGLSLTGVVAADVGASTGGFTDCMLQNGAKKVYAIDVGYGQLDWRLRNDGRVVAMERMNARNMAPDWFDEPLDFAGMDVSFISIRLILPALFTCLRPGAQMVTLVKPQFEAGRDKVGKNGVVRDPKTHLSVLQEAVQGAMAAGFTVRQADYSPITGPKGNIEYLLLLEKGQEAVAAQGDPLEKRLQEVVEQSHRELDSHIVLDKIP
ncbi:MAG: TlyA family RNA methyltransferase [Oscillospiraceae bacterium]|jgi:23S rRNA (cytidine1920-2'-O)/16S rRNA (cytidine1409-2'-O)-methyltransferase|nr:MAG: TlyA family rRNA (cytidine-2'-O)-methyltransferase [Clostridiales bacterium]